MSLLNDKSTPTTDMIDRFVNYKINRYINKIGRVVKIIKGDTVCDSDIIMDDILPS